MSFFLLPFFHFSLSFSSLHRRQTAPVNATVSAHAVMPVADGMCACVERRRQRELVIANQRLHHLQQYHTKGNPGVGNGSLAATLSRAAPGMTSSPPASVTAPAEQSAGEESVTANELPAPRHHERHYQPHHYHHHQQQQQQQEPQQEPQRRSDVNGDVFYVSGRANTAPPPPRDLDADLQSTATTTFKYLTYDRDYFRERQKSSSVLHDRNLRHSMD